MAIGVTWERFMDSCPKELKPYEVAYKNKIKEMDVMMHAWWGTYGLSAVAAAVERCIHGRKASTKYIEKPILSQIEISKKNSNKLTEEEKQKQVDLFFAEQKARRVNWKRNQKKQGQ